MKQCVCALFAMFALRAEVVVLSYDAAGNLLRQAPAVFRKSGYALAPREALLGSVRAQVLDDHGRLHPVLWVSGEDSDTGVVEVFVGVQSPPGPDSASSMGSNLHGGGHDAKAGPIKEAGGFGPVSRLDCGEVGYDRSSPLFDEHGLLAGWHVTRTVDGRQIAFAVPIAHVESMSQSMHLELPEWNSGHDAVREAPYQRGMGHLWVEDFDGALFYFTKAVELEPNNPRAWYHLGFAEGKNGHGRAKIACYRKAVELDPNFAAAHYYLGFSLLMGGDRDGAVDEYEKLRKLDESWAVRLKLFLDAAHVDVLEKQAAQNPAAAARKN